MFVWSALILGLAGNIHCLGMCGPIALSVPLKNGGAFEKILSVSLYNSGRVLVYMVLGGILGLFGHGIKIAGFQQYLSIILGGLIVLGVMAPWALRRTKVFQNATFAAISKLKGVFHSQFGRRTYSAIFTIGVFNGLLPCGLVYMAIAGSLVTGSWMGGVGYMVLFGIGTLPVMFGLPYVGHLIGNEIRNKFRKVVPIVLLLFGVLLILRGANLGIPYVSPLLDSEQSVTTIKCH